MGLQEYLAQNYLSADHKSSKKRKRKDKLPLEGLTIADDNDDSWAKPAETGDDDDAPTIVGAIRTGGLTVPVKKAKWVKVGVKAPTNSEQAAADAILADAQAESEARQQQNDEGPTVVDDHGDDWNGPTMSSGAMAGLQTAAQVTAALKRKEKAERKAMQAAGLDPNGLAQQTIYRDASGRMINVKEKRAEAESKAVEEQRKRAEELESRKGDVQRREKEAQRQRLEDAKFMALARHADDQEMNDEMRDQARWNDPMAKMVGTKKDRGGGGQKGGDGGAGSSSSSKSYRGAFEPNRYGLRPGWRWDGVDRSNGFERKWFAARNKQKEREALEFSWQLDV